MGKKNDRNNRLPVHDLSAGMNTELGNHLLPDIPLGAVYVPPEYEPHALPVAELHVDPRYQRGLDRKRVALIVANFNPQLMKPIDVNMRQDGSLWICDGQHRREVVRELLGPDALVDCHVYFGLSLAQEALLFNQQQARVDPNPTASFKSGWLSGQEPYVEIAATVKRAGFSVAEGNIRDIKAPGALLAIHKRYQDKTTLATVLDVYARAFGFDHPPKSPWLLGLAQFVNWYEGEFNAAQLVKTLQKKGRDWAVDEVEKMVVGSRMKRADAIVHLLILAHNFGQPPAKRIVSYETALARASERTIEKTTAALISARKEHAARQRAAKGQVHAGY
jgi:hypothetical protein